MAARGTLKVVLEVHRCFALFTSRNLATRLARHQPGPALHVQNAGDDLARVAKVGNEFRRHEATPRRIVIARSQRGEWVGNDDTWPVLSRRLRNDGACRAGPLDGGNRGNGRDDHARHAGTPRAFDRHVARVPRRASFVLQPFVVFVENDDCTNVGARRPRGAACADNDIDTFRRTLPIIRHESDRQPLAAKRTRNGSGLGDTRTNDKCPTARQCRLEHGPHGTTGGPHHHAATTRDERIDGDQSFPRRRTRHLRRRAQGFHAFGRGGDRQHRTERPRKTSGTPLRQTDHVGLGPNRQHVDQRFEFVTRCLAVHLVDNPRVDATAVQFDANDAADRDRAEAIRNGVVEGLVDPADIGDDANGDGQSLSAAFSASRRLNCSHENSGRLRPK